MKSRTTTDFNKARIGTPILETCGACGLETGVIIIKRKGNNKNEYIGPISLQNPDARCEFCKFLCAWIAQEEHDTKKSGKVGAAKIIERLKDGTERLVAYVPFTEHEPHTSIVNGKKIEILHGMVIRAEKDKSDYMKLVEIVKEGV